MADLNLIFNQLLYYLWILIAELTCDESQEESGDHLHSV